MKIAITGATGFIGKRLCRELMSRGHQVIAFTRDTAKAKKVLGNDVIPAIWDPKKCEIMAESVRDVDAFVNLMGENVGKGRWTKEKKRKILESRVGSVKTLANVLNLMNKKPEALILGSAIGYYGNRGDELLDESSLPGEGFLAEMASKWESSADDLKSFGIRTAIIRTSIVFGHSGGLLPRLVNQFRFFAGGIIGPSSYWFSWVHLDDEVGAIIFLLENKDLSGVFNLTAPNPVTNKDFFITLGRVLKRPCWFKTPDFLLRAILGEKANDLLFSSKRIIPKRLLDAGYKFKFSDIKSALSNLLT